MNGLGKQEGKRYGYKAIGGRQYIPAHTHEYSQHPSWDTHMVCTICGLSVSKTYLAIAASQGAIILPSLLEQTK